MKEEASNGQMRKDDNKGGNKWMKKDGRKTGQVIVVRSTFR